MRALVTGGAGFIGANLTDVLLLRGDDVVVLDDLSTGYRENVPSQAAFIEGGIEDLQAVRDAVADVDVVFHLAASRAVSRSVEDPLGTDMSNTHGSLNVLIAARDAGVKRVVLASTSSVYGGEAKLPTSEQAPVCPKSPYAVSKLAAEHYARICWELYALETVSLRFFNVYGPRQRPDSAYAAVIPLFIEALGVGRAPVIHGDGRQSRDFTYIGDVVQANLLAVEAPANRVAGQVFNVAQGGETNLLDLLAELGQIMETKPEPRFTDPRPGDVRQSRADVTAARDTLGFQAEVSLSEGLRRTVEWFTSRA